MHFTDTWSSHSCVAWNKINISWWMHLCNQLFHVVVVLCFSKELLRLCFYQQLNSSPGKTQPQKKKRNKNELSILKYSFFINFKLRLFLSLKTFGIFFLITANFYLGFESDITVSCSGGRRPSHCTQVTQCMWGFAIWIQFSLHPHHHTPHPRNKCGVNPGRPWQQKINLIHE